MTNYCYSFDEEKFHGEFETREDAIEDALDNDHSTIWTGQIVTALELLRKRKDTIGDWAAMYVDELLLEEIPSEEVIVELSDEKKKELGKLIVDFLEENASFNSYGVINIEEHNI